MIKMDYGDKTRLMALMGAYLNLFKGVPRMQSRWTNIRKRLEKKDVRFRALLPFKVTDILVADFDRLADIYEAYVALNLGKDDAIHVDAQALFSYDAHKDSKGVRWEKLQPLIAAFFMDSANGFEIHTCHYCDMAYVNPFTVKTGRKAQFDLDHVLDKGRCPIVGLSLFNFVPSCQICNGSRIKGQKVLYADARLRKKLSPTNVNYDFEEKVKILVINKKGDCSTMGFERRMDDYELKFDSHLDPDYDEEVKAFHLTERYNYHKCEALRLLDLKERYTDARIVELARMIIQSPKAKVSSHGMKYITQLKHDIFSVDFGRKYHRCFGKMREDVLG